MVRAAHIGNRYYIGGGTMIDFKPEYVGYCPVCNSGLVPANAYVDEGALILKCPWCGNDLVQAEKCDCGKYFDPTEHDLCEDCEKQVLKDLSEYANKVRQYNESQKDLLDTEIDRFCDDVL